MVVIFSWRKVVMSTIHGDMVLAIERLNYKIHNCQLRRERLRLSTWSVRQILFCYMLQLTVILYRSECLVLLSLSIYVVR